MVASANDIVECPSCGAVLTEEDVFCGECGAPRPGVTLDVRAEDGAELAPSAARGATEGAAAEPSAEADERLDRRPTPAPPEQKPAGRPLTRAERWRIVAVVVTVLAGVAACGLILLGLLLAFVIPDPDTGEVAGSAMITAASWVCFCPGVLALVAAAVLWAVAIRKR